MSGMGEVGGSDQPHSQVYKAQRKMVQHTTHTLSLEGDRIKKNMCPLMAILILECEGVGNM